MSVDPYVNTWLGGDHTSVRDFVSMARQCCAPHRLYFFAEAYGWRPVKGLPPNVRGPVPAEYRQNVVQAIGCGIKGLSSWVCSASGSGWASDLPEARALRDEIVKVNRLISHIEDSLPIGTPVDLARSDAGLVPAGRIGAEIWKKERVWAGCLLCGPDTLVIAAANHIRASRLEPPTIEPARDVTVTVTLPDFLREVEAFEATEDGLAPFSACRVDEGQAYLKIDSIESGRIFILRRR